MAETIQELLAGKKQLSQEEMKKLMLRKIIDGNKKYMEAIKNGIEQLEKLDPKDRLSFALGILVVVSSLTQSLQGWSKWCNLKNMDGITLEEFKKCFPKMRELAIKWLEIDHDITDAKTLDLEKDLEKLTNGNGDKTKKKGKTPLSNLYVA